MTSDEITPHEQQVIERSTAALQSNAEAYRLVEEAIEQRRRADAAEARCAALVAAARHAIDGLADVVCVHGPAFDSNEYPEWDSHCDICAALRSLVRALAPGEEVTG